MEGQGWAGWEAEEGEEDGEVWLQSYDTAEGVWEEEEERYSQYQQQGGQDEGQRSWGRGAGEVEKYKEGLQVPMGFGREEEGQALQQPHPHQHHYSQHEYGPQQQEEQALAVRSVLQRGSGTQPTKPSGLIRRLKEVQETAAAKSMAAQNSPGTWLQVHSFFYFYTCATSLKAAQGFIVKHGTS